VTEIQTLLDPIKEGMKQRFTAYGTGRGRLDALDLTDSTPLAKWVRPNAKGKTAELAFPEKRSRAWDAQNMFDRGRLLRKETASHPKVLSRGH